ncbi:MAG TPA: hypothetical protein VFB59_02145 [Candidatus Saccharimonadales bacterium]|nr:hypothetical protein [Candidatus Saccharimonadales bacterium]
MNVILVANGRARLKIDKWRRVLTDPFHCGVVSMNKQVQVTNPNGLHERLISPETHQRLIEVMNGKPKTQQGARLCGQKRAHSRPGGRGCCTEK